jgi:hypothetical protein
VGRPDQAITVVTANFWSFATISVWFWFWFVTTFLYRPAAVSCQLLLTAV